MFEHLKLHVLPAVVALLLSPAIAHADMGGIRDDGAFFSAQARTEALKDIHEMGKRYKKDLMFETFREIPADLKQGVDLTDKAAKDRLYEQWATKQFKQQGINGIYILIVKDPPHLQIMVGNDTLKEAFTSKDRDALRSMMLAKLHDKQNDDALRESVNFVNATLRSHLPVRALVPATGAGRPGTQGHAPPLARSHAPANAVNTTNQGSSHWILIAVIVVIGLWVVLRILGAMFSRGSGGGGGGGYQGGYQGGGMASGGGGGGGFMSSMLGGMFGAAGGMWLYDKFSGRSSQQWGGGDGGYSGQDGGYSGQNGGDSGQDSGYSGQDTDCSGSGGDFGGGDSGGGDFGGGGDSGGGDF